MPGLNTTLIAELADLREPQFDLPTKYKSIDCSTGYEKQIVQLWLNSYPPEIATGLAAAKEAMRSTFSGEYGEFWMEASPLLFDGPNLVGAICTVKKAPWERTPTCPFITDLMVAPGYRKQGIAAFLVQSSAMVVAESGAKHIALRVHLSNENAIRLYYKLGFVDWDGKLCAPD